MIEKQCSINLTSGDINVTYNQSRPGDGFRPWVHTNNRQGETARLLISRNNMRIYMLSLSTNNESLSILRKIKIADFHQ